MKMKWRLALIAGVVALVAGCSQLGYYVQAMQGQYSLLSVERPIDEWLSDTRIGDGLKGRLSKVKVIRRFAARDLDLPDNDSFINFAVLICAYVLWFVVSRPVLSMLPVLWCFPFAGCVFFRG